MNLHNNKELFEQAILQASEKYGINPAIVEKDYYVTLMLQYLVTNEPRIIFKGGTSLSKCYKLIQRFSEDIDLNFNNNLSKPTEGMRKSFSNLIKEAGNALELEFLNMDKVRSRRDFNQYQFGYASEFSLPALKPVLVVETAIAIRSFPTEIMKADSILSQYLISEGFTDILSEYGLEAFDVTVQTKERTFVDKIFAICDYYLTDRTNGHSRHLYDLFKLYPVIDLKTESFHELVQEVRLVRMESPICPSAQKDCDVKAILQEIIAKEIYKNDYQEITHDLLFEKVSYSNVIESLEAILTLDVWKN